MINSRQIVEHIFADSHFPKLQILGKEHQELTATIQEAKKYVCGGNFSEDKSQKLLKSIFDGLGNDKVRGYFFEPQVLNLTNDFFPNQNTKENNFDLVFEGFTREFNQIKHFEQKAFVETTLALMEKYFTTIPCQVKGLETVSLFDYLKSLLSFTICLQESKSIMLLGADLSGIQSFIYDIIGKNASKNLKGRSFYLQLLVDNILQILATRLNLCSANIIYSSGGSFFVIAPRNEKNLNIFNDFKEYITKKILANHKTNIFLSFATQELKLIDLENNKLGEVWGNLIEKLNSEKRKKFNKILVTNYQKYFEPTEIGGIQARDAVTNEEFTENERKVPLDENSVNVDFVKVETKRQVLLGGFLKDTNYLLKTSKGNIKVDYFLKYPFSKEITNFFTKYSPIQENINVTSINDLDFLKNQNFSKNTYNFTFYGGNQSPTIKIKDKRGMCEEVSKTFSELAGQKEQEEEREYWIKPFEEPNLKRLGILRMDVDNLGFLFKDGFKQTKSSLSKYSALSRNLDYFFKGYLNTIWQNNPNYKNYTYILYSGGDDLFILGRWNYLIEFAYDIQKEFKKWTCENTKLTLSGGIAIVPPKFPIAKASNLAEIAEKLAKNHTYKYVANNQEIQISKNSFALLGVPLNWEHEFPLVKYLKETLVELIQNNEILPKSFLHRITGFYEQRKIQIEQNQNQKWRWQISYDFAQMKRRSKDSESEASKFLEKIKLATLTDKLSYQENNYKKDKYTFLELLSLACRWAELEIRK